MYKISVPLHISTIQRAGRDGLVDNLRKLHAERVFLWLGNCTTDEDKMTEYNEQLQDCYKKIMANESMIAYNEAKVALDEIVNKVNLIISMCIDGADPKTVEIPDASCSGSCSTCGGCH